MPVNESPAESVIKLRERAARMRKHADHFSDDAHASKLMRALADELEETARSVEAQGEHDETRRQPE
jgi:hypothetical protein